MCALNLNQSRTETGNELAGPYKDEAALRAELRALTEQTKKLRQELRGMLGGSVNDDTRALIQVRVLPKVQPPAATAADRPKRRKKKR